MWWFSSRCSCSCCCNQRQQRTEEREEGEEQGPVEVLLLPPARLRTGGAYGTRVGIRCGGEEMGRWCRCPLAGRARQTSAWALGLHSAHCEDECTRTTSGWWSCVILVAAMCTVCCAGADGWSCLSCPQCGVRPRATRATLPMLCLPVRLSSAENSKGSHGGHCTSERTRHHSTMG